MSRPKSSNSWCRKAEAMVIADMIKEWVEYDDRLSDETGSEPLTFGVISFYKAQTELVKEMLGDKWLQEHCAYKIDNDNDSQHEGDDEEEDVEKDRLMIGTVDSFQGREFDVVFLSLVRTADKGFGFLKLYNRLNVSMSRQKRLLVAVGDAASYDTGSAREQVPGLTDFLRLCREEGRML